MARDLLSNLDDWGLVYDEQDLRGRDVYDDAGNRVGTVRDLMADTDRAEIVALVLDDGREVDTGSVEIGDDRVLLHSDASLATARAERSPSVYADADARTLRRSDGGAAAAAAAAGTSYAADRADDERLRERAEEDLRDRGIIDTGADDRVTLDGDDAGARPISEAGATGADPYTAPYTTAGGTAAPGATHTPSGTDAGAYAGMAGMGGGAASAYSDDDDRYFREDYDRTYGAAGGSYDEYAPAYRAGYAYGGRHDYRDRSFDALEPDVRRDYEGRYGEGTWDRFKDAVRRGFDRARNAVTGGDDDRRSTPY